MKRSPIREYVAAWVAFAVAALIFLIVQHFGAGLLDAIGVALMGWIVVVIAIASTAKGLRLIKVITSTGRGAIVSAVVLVLFLIGVARSFSEVVS